MERYAQSRDSVSSRICDVEVVARSPGFGNNVVIDYRTGGIRYLVTPNSHNCSLLLYFLSCSLTAITTPKSFVHVIFSAIARLIFGSHRACPKQDGKFLSVRCVRPAKSGNFCLCAVAWASFLHMHYDISSIDVCKHQIRAPASSHTGSFCKGQPSGEVVCKISSSREGMQ